MSDIFVDERQAEPVAEFCDEELIAFEERGDHRSRGDFEGLNEECAQHERDGESDEDAFDKFLET